MNKLKSIVNTLSNWLINLKKQKISLLLITALISIFFTMTGFSEANIQDNAHILDKDTNRLIIEKNDRYFQTKEQPQIIVRTVKRVNKLTPKHLNKFKRTVFIVAGVKKISTMFKYILVGIYTVLLLLIHRLILSTPK